MIIIRTVFWFGAMNWAVVITYDEIRMDLGVESEYIMQYENASVEKKMRKKLGGKKCNKCAHINTCKWWW